MKTSPVENRDGVVRAAVAVWSAAWLATNVARAELKLIENAEERRGFAVYQMTVTPAPEPTLALKYRLSPGPLDLRPGNAALHYLRAFAEGGVSQIWKGIVNDYTFEEVEGSGDQRSWYDVARPLGTLPLEQARQAAARFDVLINQNVARAVLRQDVDWGRNLQELRGMELVNLLLPDVQETRSLARALMLRARVAIADGDYDRAIEQIRMTYRMGQHVASDPILISGLVGIAEASMATNQLIELIAAPNSPNMYWALAELPRPLIDLRSAVRLEFSWGLRMFPFLEDAEEQRYSPEEWARQLTNAVVDMQTLSSAPVSQPRELLQAGVAAVSLVAYPTAKQRLMDRGFHVAEVERMPVGQVIAIDAAHEFQRVGHELEKSWYVPYTEAKRFADAGDLLLGAERMSGGYGRVLAGLLLPAVNAARGAQLRLERQLNAVQAIEAIRMHAAETGKLPRSLEEIDVVPAPENPATGRPFAYRLEGETAVLELPPGEVGGDSSARFEIKLAK